MSETSGTIDAMPLAPDTQITIKLIATAARLYDARGDRDAAIAELQGIAGGRVDLLSGAAGHHLGAGNWNSAACHQLLVDAGGTDQKILDAEAARVRSNVAGNGHTSASIHSPR